MYETRPIGAEARFQVTMMSDWIIKISNYYWCPAVYCFKLTKLFIQIKLKTKNNFENSFKLPKKFKFTDLRRVTNYKISKKECKEEVLRIGQFSSSMNSWSKHNLRIVIMWILRCPGNINIRTQMPKAKIVAGHE